MACSPSKSARTCGVNRWRALRCKLGPQGALTHPQATRATRAELETATPLNLQSLASLGLNSPRSQRQLLHNQSTESWPLDNPLSIRPPVSQQASRSPTMNPAAKQTLMPHGRQTVSRLSPPGRAHLTSRRSQVTALRLTDTTIAPRCVYMAAVARGRGSLVTCDRSAPLLRSSALRI